MNFRFSPAHHFHRSSVGRVEKEKKLFVWFIVVAERESGFFCTWFSFNILLFVNHVSGVCTITQKWSFLFWHKFPLNPIFIHDTTTSKTVWGRIFFSKLFFVINLLKIWQTSRILSHEFYLIWSSIYSKWIFKRFYIAKFWENFGTNKLFSLPLHCSSVFCPIRLHWELRLIHMFQINHVARLIFSMENVTNFLLPSP